MQNLEADKEFSVYLEFARAYNDKKESICGGSDCSDNPPSKWLLYGGKQIISRDQLKTFPVKITVPKKAPDGVYIFDAKVCAEDKCTESSKSYDNAVHKLYVRVG